MKKKPIVCITPGDPEGVGPEIVLKTLFSKSSPQSTYRPLLVGDSRPFLSSKYKNHFKLLTHISEVNSLKNKIGILVPITQKKNPLPGWYAGASLELATQLCLNHESDALVTGPIDKSRLQKGGYPYFGHTDMLADLCKVPAVTMMLANSKLKVSLVTVHCALNKVSSQITEERIERAILQTTNFLQNQLGILSPKIAVLSLNPHAGEKGLMGKEEIETIQPALLNIQKKLKLKNLTGPFPSDTFFTGAHLKVDAVIAMYHDQGLIPVKMIDFKNTVNLTLGLPIIRTSVDHGTAFDIAGKGIADPSSMIAALKLALKMIKQGKGNKKQ